MRLTGPSWVERRNEVVKLQTQLKIIRNSAHGEKQDMALPPVSTDSVQVSQWDRVTD